jgi:glutamyl-tRNA reductase
MQIGRVCARIRTMYLTSESTDLRQLSTTEESCHQGANILSTHVLLIGVNHTTASVTLRERLAISGTRLAEALTHFGLSNSHGPTLLPEGVILSTCNRLEIYAVADDVHQGHEALVQFLSQNRSASLWDRQVSVKELADVVYLRSDAEAVTHLTQVACGLDSMIVGEPQILGQVTDAYQAALSRNATGPVLNTLFRHAIQAGKRARTETAISQYATSVPSAAAALAEQEMGDLKDRIVLVIGAGDMGQIAARTLMARGAKGIIVANRTYDRGLKLARELNCEAMTFDRQAEALARADIVVTATDAPHVIVTPQKMTTAMVQRPERPMLIVDIAVPRDTDPAVADIPGVRLFDIDDLHDVVNGNLEARQREIPRVEAIVAEEAAAFMAWFHALDVVPTITDLRHRAEAIKAQELDKALDRLGGLSDREREVVRALAHGLVNKLLHEPTIRLKQHAAQGNGYLYTGVARELFGLEVKVTRDT